MAWLNRKELTGERMFNRFGRKPGSGRFKCKLLAYEANLEKEQQKTTNETVKAKIGAALTQLRNLFNPPVVHARRTKSDRAN